jgi:protein-S-isoprenylcysteine O-methyltransferase Ste14
MTDLHAQPSRFPWPPLIYVAAIAASILLHFLYELPWLNAPMSDILFAAGFLFVLAGVALVFSALRAMRAANTTPSPVKAAAHLVTSGAFSITRNPLYLANTVVMLGIGLISGIAWFLILALVAAFLTQKLAIEPEEKHLELRFGKRYRDYLKKVRRWI